MTEVLLASGFCRQLFIREMPSSDFFVVAVSMVHELVGVVGQLRAVRSPAVDGACIEEDGVFLAKEIKLFADAWFHQSHIISLGRF